MQLLTDFLISDQNLPFADMQACSLNFTQKFLWKGIIGYLLLKFELVCSNKLKICFFWWKCMKCMLEYMIRQYKSFLSKFFCKGKSRRKELQKVSKFLGHTLWVCLKASKVYLAMQLQNTCWSSSRCLVLLKALVS